MQTKPSPNMLRARMPAPQHLQEMFHLEAVVDFPAEEVHAVGGTKAAFNAALFTSLPSERRRTLAPDSLLRQGRSSR
jgi:hypothetical protein